MMSGQYVHEKQSQKKYLASLRLLRVSRPEYRVLLALWLAFLCKGAFYAVVFPIWEGFDEFAHFAFIQHIANYHELTVPDTRVSHEIDASLELAPLPWELIKILPSYTTHDAYWQLPPTERIRRQKELLAIS